MELFTLFFQRYDPLHSFYLDGFWATVPPEKMRQRPYPRTNSIAWNLWHLTRVEDAGLNRFVADQPQVLDVGDWLARLNVPWRHHGSGMSLAEVDELSQCIDLAALQGYAQAVQARTRTIVSALDDAILDSALDEPRLRQIMVDEGLAHSNADGFIQNYLGWTRGKCLLTFGLTHAYQHLGEMEVLATLVGVAFN